MTTKRVPSVTLSLELRFFCAAEACVMASAVRDRYASILLEADAPEDMREYSRARIVQLEEFLEQAHQVAEFEVAEHDAQDRGAVVQAGARA